VGGRRGREGGEKGEKKKIEKKRTLPRLSDF
jgi:hypothetical protein